LNGDSFFRTPLLIRLCAGTQKYFAIFDNNLIDKILTPHITGIKKQSEERAALFYVRVNVIVQASRFAAVNPCQ
jgi:hypothetical protein